MRHRCSRRDSISCGPATIMPLPSNLSRPRHQAGNATSRKELDSPRASGMVGLASGALTAAKGQEEN
jgi:hypothetical protein